MDDVCNNCGGKKPTDRYAACPACRAEWRARARTPGGPAEKLDCCARAIAYLLNRSRHDDELYYRIGRGTEAFRLLTEAQAVLTGRPVAEVVKIYAR